MSPQPNMILQGLHRRRKPSTILERMLVNLLCTHLMIVGLAVLLVVWLFRIGK